MNDIQTPRQAAGLAPLERSIFTAPQTSDGPPQDGPLTLPAFLREVTTRYAGREALVWRTREAVVRWSYATVWARALEVAQALIAGGLGKDSRVGVMMTNRPEWVSTFFGVSLAGGVAVPLSTFSTGAELHYLLQATAVSTLIFERQVVKKDFAVVLGELIPELATARPGRLMAPTYPHLRQLVVLGDDPAPAGMETWDDFLGHGRDVPAALVEAAALAVKPADIAGIFFTSGSTNLPKGTIHRHYAVAITPRRWAWLFQLKDGVRAWGPNGLFWSGTFTNILASTWQVGGSMVLQAVFNPAEALELIDIEKVNFAHAWPHQLAAMEEAPNFADVDLASLSYLDEANVLSRHPSVRLTGWRKPTWAFGCSETFTLNSGFSAAAPPELVAGSHGPPLPGNTFKVIDPQTGQILPIGERGELCIKGPTLMVNYLGIHPSETFDDDGFYHTGDGARLDAEGRFFWEGRLSDVIKTGGANVSPVEVTQVLVRCPGVKIGMTVGVPHPTLGELVVACVVPMDGSGLTEEAVRDFIRVELASYKVPRRVLFFDEEDIALTSNNKIKSKNLKDIVIDRLST